VRGDGVQHFGREAAGLAHAFDILGGFDGDAHAKIIPSGF
jgi:hypothetical protein